MPDPARPDPFAREAPVLVFGGANLDLLARCTAAAVLGDSNPGQLHSSPGGVGRNIAQRLAELGRAVRLVAALGDDEAGQQLRAQGRGVGIDMGGCISVPGARTARYLAVHQADGELLVAVNDMAVAEQLTPACLQAEAEALQAAPAVVLEANLSPALLAALWPLPVPLWADAVSAAKCGRLAGGLARLHTLKPDRLEALQLTGLPADSSPQALADALHRQGVRQVALSLGADGLLLSRREADGALRRHHEPAQAVAQRLVNGAGDALLAGLLHAQLGGLGFEASAAAAVACAARALAGLALLPGMANASTIPP